MDTDALNVPPFKIKMVERITLPSARVREKELKEGHLNVFKISAKNVFIDLLTDSGTSAMSDRQWSALLVGDESYAGGESFSRFKKSVQEIFGHVHVIPTHQGRAAEHIFFSHVLKNPDRVIPNNTHFDTTRANIEQLGGLALDLPCAESKAVEKAYPFKGNMDLEALEKAIARFEGRIPLVMMTITNNACAGAPASLENMQSVKKILRSHGIPLFFDACRFAENCYFIKKREAGQGGRTLREIARDIFSLADGCIMSAKKDGLANIGGFITLREDGDFLQALSNRLILYEGFPTYGGLAGRDLEAIARGLQEVMEEDYLAHRTGQVAMLIDILRKANISVVMPPGGHAVYVDACRFLPHIPKEHFPGQALCIALYRHYGIRGVELGSVMFDNPPPPLELVRLAIPRRVYTNDHIRYVGHALGELSHSREKIKGVKITKAPPFLRHFTAEFVEV